MKKTLSVILSILMAFSAFSVMPFSASADETKYYLIGNMNDWGVSEAYAFTKVDETEYVFENVALTTTSQFKIVSSTSYWYPDGLGNNIGENGEITADGNYDVYFRPDCAGDSSWFYGCVKVKPAGLEYEKVYVVGSTETYSSFLNGISWNPSAPENAMTEVAEDVWEIEYKNVRARNGQYVFKFAIDGGWSNNFGSGGGDIIGSGVEYNAVWNGDNICFDMHSAFADVKIRLDLSNFNSSTKTGATFTITLTEPVTEYSLWLAGTRVTSANAGDVLGDGTVSYNAETNTLTLNNAVLKGTDSISGLYGVINSELPELNIKLIGNNVIDGEGSNDGIDAAGGCNVNIVGEGSLSINNAYYGTYIGDWETAGGNLTVKDGATVTVTESQCAGIWANNDITFENSTVTVNRTGDNYNGIVANTAGTVTVTSSNLTVNNKSSAILLGNADGTPNKFVINSGIVVLNTEGYGIEQATIPDVETIINAVIEINGGMLDITSAKGGTNIKTVTVAADLGYSVGSALSESGHIVIEKHNHSYTEVVTAPTCTKKGYTAHTCTCGDSYVDTYVNALGHDFGTNEKVCKRCGIANPGYISPADAKLPTEKKTEEIIKKTNTDKKDVAGSDYQRLMLKATAGNKAITLKWKKIKGADGYIIYGAPCGQNMKRMTTIKNPKTVKKTYKKLKKGKYYKYIVVAYKKTGKGNRVISKSKSVHCATKGGKKGNPTGIKLKKTKITLKKGKKTKIKATLQAKGKVATHIAKFRYESSNKKIATVDKNGNIKANKKGTCTIYVYAQNGICKTVKVNVK